MRSRREALQAILLDLDGVLWDTAPYHLEAYNEALAPLGIAIPEYAPVAGRRTDEVIDALLGAEVPDRAGVVAAVTQAKRRAFLALMDRHPPDLSATREVLQRLASRHRLALCSSASAGSVAYFLGISATQPLFTVVLSGEDVEHAKPAPDIYAAAVERLGIAPDAGVAVEDSQDGIRAARGAGLDVIAVRGTASDTALGEAGASSIIDGIDRLEEALAR